MQTIKKNLHHVTSKKWQVSYNGFKCSRASFNKETQQLVLTLLCKKKAVLIGLASMQMCKIMRSNFKQNYAKIRNTGNKQRFSQRGDFLYDSTTQFGSSQFEMVM